MKLLSPVVLPPSHHPASCSLRFSKYLWRRTSFCLHSIFFFFLTNYCSCIFLKSHYLGQIGNEKKKAYKFTSPNFSSLTSTDITLHYRILERVFITHNFCALNRGPLSVTGNLKSLKRVCAVPLPAGTHAPPPAWRVLFNFCSIWQSLIFASQFMPPPWQSAFTNKRVPCLSSSQEFALPCSFGFAQAFSYTSISLGCGLHFSWQGEPTKGSFVT